MNEIAALPTLRLKVREAARQMLLEGKLPTGRAVRDIVGTGSMQTIYNELDHWAREFGEHLAMPAPPDPLQQLFDDLWKQALQAADVRHAATLQERDALIAGLRESITSLESRIASDRMAHEERRQALQATLDEYREKFAQVSEALSRHQVGETEALRQVEKLAFQLEEARSNAASERTFLHQEASRAEHRYEEGLKSADLRYRALEDRVMTEADAAKVAGKKALEAAEAAHGRLMAEAQKRLQDALREIEHVRAEAGTSQQRIGQLATENTTLQVELAASRAQLESQNARIALLEENVTLMRRLAEKTNPQEKPDAGPHG